MTVDKHCYECKVRYRDPKPQDLVMYLHAWKYQVIICTYSIVLCIEWIQTAFNHRQKCIYQKWCKTICKGNWTLPSLAFTQKICIALKKNEHVTNRIRLKKISNNFSLNSLGLKFLISKRSVFFTCSFFFLQSGNASEEYTIAHNIFVVSLAMYIYSFKI